MVCEIIKDIDFLSIPSTEATVADLKTATDLLDTLKANSDYCVGMAANMIGVSKRIIAFDNGGKYEIMLNPEITRKDTKYEVEEGCLSLEGTRKATRFRNIKVQYMNEKMQLRIKNYTDFTAEIIQHEIDHCNGIII